MQNNLPKLVVGTKKRAGQGRGSGRGGHTSGRGQKGQKARGKIGILFEGVKMKKSFIKRLPFQRGRGKLEAGVKPQVVSLALLNNLPDGSVVDLGLLKKHRIVVAEARLVKILDGKLERKNITIKLPISHSAGQTVEKLGGKVEI